MYNDGCNVQCSSCCKVYVLGVHLYTNQHNNSSLQIFYKINNLKGMPQTLITAIRII